ncbi:anti-sigma factor [Nocardioides sp.]|uniref:anti-sigma factor n=1 Tax=Nocardioides sp. TaxID=35761 RepID=UPI003D0A07F7
MNNDNRDLTPDIHALSGAYALDALDDIERARFEAHLAECSVCREEVASLTEAAGLLGASSELTPPPALRDAVLGNITRIRPLPPQPARPVVTDDLAQHRQARRRRFPQLVAAAAAVVALGVGATVWHPWNDDSSQTISVADQVLSAPDATKVTHEIDGASATLVTSKSLGKAVLVAKDMPAAPSGKVYELWFQNAQGKVTSAGLMTGSGDQTVVLQGDASQAVWAGITVEPEGGSDAPTMPTIAAFDFQDLA